MPIVYDDKAMVERGSFKTFMRRHVRKALPAHYKNLMEGAEILGMEDILGYLVKKVGHHMVDGAHYMDKPPFRQFAGSNVFTNQRYKLQTFKGFIDEHMWKFTEGRNKNHDPRDINNILYQVPLFEELKEDIQEPDAVNIALDYKYTALNVFS